MRLEKKRELERKRVRELEREGESFKSARMYIGVKFVARKEVINMYYFSLR